MLSYRLPVPCALTLALTLMSACNPEGLKISQNEDPADPGPTVLRDGGKGPGADMDAGRRDAGSTPRDQTADGSVSADGGTASDAGSSDLDAASQDAGAALADAGSTDAGATDGGSTDGGSTDAGRADAGAADAGGGDAGADAGRDAGGDAGRCDVDDPRFGCGTRLSVDWIHFRSGLDIDTKYGRAWSPVVEVDTLQALRSSCQDLVIAQLNDFEVPEVDDVRTLAAGCDPTRAEGACQVQNGVVLPSNAGNCTCNTGIGPNKGKFCRDDVPDCETLWTATDCGVGNAECVTRRSWFYDVRTGSLVLAAAGQGVAEDAKGRCVQGINYTAP